MQEAAQCSSSSYMKHHNSIPHQIAQPQETGYATYLKFTLFNGMTEVLPIQQLIHCSVLQYIKGPFLDVSLENYLFLTFEDPDKPSWQCLRPVVSEGLSTYV